MCDCFHLVLPNWPGSPASASGRQLRPEDTEADGEADVEDDSINDEEVTTENIRPRPQGSSPVYEYCIDAEYFNKKLQQDRENRQRRDSSIKMSESQESMEVTLQTEVESGASGFSVAGGGSEGIFVKQVLKESPASKVFSLKEGDQLLSATIFFDNIKYEDALKILQYSEPYKVQFNLKRKLVGKEEMESMYSAKQSKKEKLIQGKEILEISEKMVSEEDKANLIVKQRVGRPKRTKKDRLSWPKFQSMKGKRILGHRRSRSTSDAYEHTIPDISPTSTDTESQFQQEELHAKIKKGSQKRLKFPSIGFKMYKSKQETEERTKYEVKPLTEFENDTTGEITELITTQYSTKWDEHGMKEGKEKHVITVMETKPELQHPPKKCPEVELTIKKPKDKKMKSGKATTETETAIITSQIMSALQTNEGQPKMATQSLPKTRKKKHKGSKEKIELETEGEKGKKQKQGIKEKNAEKIKDANIMITPPHMRAHISEATCEATGQASFQLEPPELQVEASSEQIALDSAKVKLEDMDSKFKMPKLHMPRFAVSLPKGKPTLEEETALSSMDTEVTKNEMKGDVTLPSVTVKEDIMFPKAKTEAMSLEVEVTEKGKFKMPDVKMPSVQMPQGKTPQVGVSLPKVEADISLPKGKIELPEGEVSVMVSEAEGSVEGGGMKIHMPKFKMPSMGFSKTDIKGPKVDVDLSLPKVDVTLPSADLSITKQEPKTGDLQADISVSGPDVHVPSGEATLELKAPELQMEAPAAQIALDGTEVKLEGVDSRFKMPKFHMPKFGVSLPKGWSTAEGEIVLPSIDVEVTKPELKADVALPSVGIEGDIKLLQAEIEAPSFEVELEEKGKFKSPDVKMPSVKMPKGKTPQVGVNLPKVEADVSLPKGQIELPETEVSVKDPKAEGSVEGGGMKIHMPKFKMPSLGFSKTDVKGPKLDVDLSLPKVDVTFPSADLSITKPELKTGDLQTDIGVSGPDVHVPSGEASLELKAPELQMEASAAQIALDGSEVKLEGVDSRFKMPKFHMPRFGMSRPKGKAAAQGELALPSLDVEVTKPELKTDVTLPSVEVESDIKLPQVEIEGPSLEVEGKFKMPDVKMPSIKMPQAKTPQVGVSLPKVEADISLPKGKIELPEGEVSVMVPEAEGSVEGGGMKIHMPKFKMPSMGFSKQDAKGPKVDVDLSLPKVDVTLPSTDLSITKPELKTGDLQTDINVSSAEVHVPSGQTSLELKSPDLQIEVPAAEIALDATEAKLEGVDSRFKMPKFHMPRFGMSRPKGKATAEGELTLPCTDDEKTKPELKADVTVPSFESEGDIKLPQAEIEAPSLEVEVGEKGKIKMPDVKVPSIKMPKTQTPEVGASLPKVEADVSLPKGKIELPEAGVSVKVPELEGSMEDGGMKMHMPKFKMPVMDFSKPDVKGPNIDMDLSLPKVDATLPVGDVSITKSAIKTDELQTDGKITKSQPLEKDTAEKESKFKMPKFKLPSFSWSPKKETSLSADIGANLDDSSIAVSTQEPELTLTVEEVTTSDVKKGIKMSKVKLPSLEFSKPEIKAPKMDMEASLTKSDIQVPTLDIGLSEPVIRPGDISAAEIKVPMIKSPEVSLERLSTEISVDGAELRSVTNDGKIKRSKFQMPKFGISFPKGKVPEAGISLPSEGIDVPQLKTTTDIGDIAVEAPTYEVEYDSTCAEKKVLEENIKISQIPTADLKTAVDIKVPSDGFSLEQPETETPFSDATETKPEKEMKTGSLDAEQKEGNFKMPKFKLPSFNWSPKKEATIKTNIKESLEEPKLTAYTDAELKIVLSQDQEVQMDEDAESSIKKSQSKRSHFIMPKISLTKTKLAKSQDKVETDITVERDGDVVQIPDIESSFTTKKEEEMEISIKMPKGISKSELKAPHVDTDITLSKGGIEVYTVDSSSEMKSSEIGLEGDIVVERGSVTTEDEGKIRLLKLQMPKFGIAVPKQEWPESSITSTEMESRVPQKQLTIETDGLSGEIPTLEVKTDASDTKVSAGKIKMAQTARGEIKASDSSVVSPDEKDVKSQGELEAKSGEVQTEDSQGWFKMPKFRMPSFGRSKGKKDDIEVEVSTGKAPIAEGELEISASEVEIESAHVDMESCAGKNLFEGKEITDSGISVQKEKEFDVGLLDEGRLSQLSGKADHKLTALGTKITEEDFEIIDFPIEGFEKDALTEDKVKVEDADGLSKAKTSKFKMPKFGNLRTKPKVSEVLIEPAKVEIEGTPGITEDVILGIQTQSGVCSADMKITKTDFTEEPIEFIDKHFEDSEQSFHITKFKMPKFIYRTSTVEEQSLPSEGTVDKKSTGIDTDSALQPEFRTTLLEEKIESQDSVQKSKVKITTLSEPTIQRTHMESKLPSTESSFEETTHIKRPTEFSCGFPAEIKQTTDGKIQKSVAKISTVREPDIQTTQLEIKLPSDESFISSKPLPMQGPYKKSKEIKIVSKSEFSKGDEEESFSTQIVRESEIPPSEVKTAAYGFSLLKVKIQESHVTVDKPVKLSSAEYMNETFESKDHQPSDESSEQPTQKTGFTEMKLSHKGEDSGFTEGLTSTTTLTKVKAFTVEVQSSSDFSESHHDKHPEEMSESAIAVTEETKIVRTEAEPTDQKEKSDSKRSPGRFKFWFQNIGYSSSADDATSDSKPEDQKSFPETEPDEPSTSESESSKQTEKAGWFRLPKLGFSSPTKKSKETGKEEDLDRTDKNQDDESPTEKTETFFDAQETLSPKDTITEKEGGEISGALPCEPIVSSSARTELILLEKEKATLQSIPEEASK